jgi:hypothetical protein
MAGDGGQQGIAGAAKRTGVILSMHNCEPMVAQSAAR